MEQYIHRIGRTGRAGRTGDAITLVEGRERRQLRAIEQMIGTTIKPARIPTAADIAARRRDLFQESLRETLAARAFDGHLATVEALGEEYDSSEIAAAALQMLWQSQHSGPAEAAEELNADSEQPEVGMTRLFVGLGRQDGLRPGDLVGAISNEAGIGGQDYRRDRHIRPDRLRRGARAGRPEGGHRPAERDDPGPQGQDRSRPARRRHDEGKGAAIWKITPKNRRNESRSAGPSPRSSP